MGADPCAGATKDGRILHLSLRGAAEKKFPLCCTKTCNFSLHSRRECRDLAEGGAALWSFVAVRPPPGPGAPGGGSPAAGRGSGGRGPAEADAVHRRCVGAVHLQRCVGGREARRAGRKLIFTGGIFLNQTSNYQLSQWDPEDRILRTDFNSDNAKIDAALEGLKSICNCQIYYYTYTGTGTNGPLTFQFPYKPMFMAVQGGDAWLIGVYGAAHAHGTNWGSTLFPPLVWGDTTLTVGTADYDALQCCNSKNTVYSMVVLLDVSA